MITSIIKRDGSIEPFNPEKIVIAISKAGSATGEFDTQVSKELVQSMVLPRINAKKGRAVSVEDVQDIVENVLFDTAFEKTYKAYALYRENRRKNRDARKALIDVEKSMNEYLRQDDWRVRANANQGYSLGGMILNISGKVTANYWLNNVYPEEVGVAHRNGDYHIHDLDMLSGYCAGWSLRSLLNEGFNGVANKVESNPPKHVSSALLQMVNFLGSLQNEWAGAQAFSSFDTYLAPFVRVDKLSYEELKQRIQEFIYNLNVPSRWGTQTPFTNLTFDIHCPEDIRDDIPLIGGKEVDFKYGDLQKEMDMINKAYMEVMIAGDAHGRIFTFPIPTYNISKDFDWDSANSELLFEMTAKYGLPYFQNFINSELKPNQIRSMCPLSANTKVRVRIGGTLECTVDIGKLFGIKDEIEVSYKNEWHKAKLVRATKQKTRKIYCSNAEYVEMGVHHLQPVLIDGKIITLTGADLTCGMKLPKDDSYIDHTRIIDIQEGEVRDDLYCFEVENEERLFTLANGLITHNCRLQLDLRELLKRGNGLFGSAEQTGSVGVVTINCARLGYIFKGDKEGLYKRLDYLMGLAKTSLEIKRKEVQKHMDQGLFPFTKRYLGTLRNHFSTIGVNGINEMIRNFTNDKFDITSEEGHAFAIEFLDHVRAKMVEYQEETGNLYNLEATPAEGTTYRFAKEDKKRWPDIIQAGTTKNNYYTNSSQLPVGFTDDPFEALEMQDDLQRKYTGGTVLHLYMGERISTSHACKELVKRALTHFKLPYITITPTFSICPKHGYIAGEHKFCPLCDDELVAKKKRALLKCQKAGTGK